MREEGRKTNRSSGAFLGGEENFQKQRAGMNTLMPCNKEVPKKETNQKSKKA